MNNPTFYSSKRSTFFYVLAGLAIAAALTLSILSIMELCTSSCVEGHKFRIFGFKFEEVGIVFFAALLIAHLLGWKSPLFSLLTGLGLAGAVGSELYFIYLQKFVIGSWCPVCLGIAACVGVAAISYSASYFTNFAKAYKEGILMSHIAKSFPSIFTAFFCLFASFVGISKINPLEAAQQSMKDSIAFGTSSGPIEAYFFTDWFCPACKEIEPVIRNASPRIQKEAKLYFIDANIHDESMNFTPYNVSFMVNNKPEYLELRQALFNVAENTESPSDTLIERTAAKYGATFKELGYKDIALASKLFSKMKRQFSVHSTPTLIIVNLNTKKGKRLSGTSEITEKNIFDAIRALQ